jgi:uncharacterized protein (TIGR02001 family)
MAAKPVRLLGSILVAVATIAGSAAAQDAPWSVNGTAGVVSDYRYRGYSLSGEDPALQAGLTVSHASGFYGDTYVSSIEEYGVGNDGDGAKIELTLSAGWAGAIAGFDVDAGVSAYRYPHGSGVSYVEFPLQAGKTLGAATWTVGFAYAPKQSALGDEDNGYVWGSLAYARPAWPVSLAATLGYEDGAYAPGGKTDWSLGVTAPVGPMTLDAAWIDSDADSGALVARAFFNF